MTIPARVALVVMLFASTALAQEAARGQARARFERGTQLFAIEHYDEAIKEFEAGYLLAPRPEFLYNIGRCHREAKRPEQAARYFERFLDLAPDSPDRAEVEREIARLRALAVETPKAAPPKAAPPPLATAPPVPEPAPAPSAQAPANTAAISAAALTPPSPSPKAPGHVPLYRRWWLWTGIAVVAAIGAGVAIGVATRPTTPEAGTDLGTFSPGFQ